MDEFARSDICSWLMDTGCKHDLTTRDAISLCQVGVITKAKTNALLSIANDIISSDIMVPRQIGALACDAEPYVLDQSPDVLSIGRRCVQEGYSFQWLPYSLVSTLRCPTRKVVKLVSRVGCPYLDDYEPSERSVAAPAVAPLRPNAFQQRADVITCEGKDNTDSGWDEP